MSDVSSDHRQLDYRSPAAATPGVKWGHVVLWTLLGCALAAVLFYVLVAMRIIGAGI